MPIRRFLVASGVARLIQRELGSQWRVEGYLNGGDNRRTHIVLEGNQGQLVLEETVDGRVSVEETPVSRRQVEALFGACVGRLDIERSILNIDGRPAVLDRLMSRGRRLDLLTVYLDEGTEASFFAPPWVGRDAKDDGFDHRSLATQGIPDQGESGVSNAGLEAILDFLERGQPGATAAPRAGSGANAPAQAQVQEPSSQPASRANPAADPAEPKPSPRIQQIRQGLATVLANPATALPAERSTPASPDQWGERRKR